MADGMPLSIPNVFPLGTTSEPGGARTKTGRGLGAGPFAAHPADPCAQQRRHASQHGTGAERDRRGRDPEYHDPTVRVRYVVDDAAGQHGHQRHTYPARDRDCAVLDSGGSRNVGSRGAFGLHRRTVAEKRRMVTSVPELRECGWDGRFERER